MTEKQLLSKGEEPLSLKQLQEQIIGNSVHLEAIDFDANVQFLPGGKISATDLQGKTEKGQWSISADNQLCLKFKLWYFGDLNCYTLFKQKSDYFFFTGNGAKYYTGKITKRADATEIKSAGERKNQITKDKGNDAVRYANSSSHGETHRSDIEKQHTLINLARNCPGCNLAGVTLRGAQLIGANLAGANLSGADLSEANLRRADLSGANLSGAKFTRTNLSGANLTGSDLSNADLTGSNLIRATITDANLDGAQLDGAHLESIQGMKY